MNQEEQFLSVLEDNKGILYKLANAYCRDIEDRKDLVQEMVFQLWKSFDNYHQTYKVSTWMYRVALNVAISFYRKDHKRKGQTDSITDSILNLTESGVSTDEEQRLLLLQQFISELKELDKAVMLLYLEEKSHRVIAEIVGLSESNVGTKINRIKTTLTQKFSTIKNQY
ncbi:MAG: sigma-70 family RNA polymerase sigma factor [Saprospiraceae bacterium]|nr:sigma-70 family RNA polymerase sigma factor [Saprospiraceae bacterium]